MELKHLFTADDENRAVSPVIGVILMVAITVILAAVIGTFVLGLGDQVQQTSPNAQWDWSEDTSNQEVTVTHEGGDAIADARLTWGGALSGDAPFGSEVTAGVSATGGGSLTSGDEVLLIWTAEGGGQSTTLSEYEYQG
jgi:flagellin-like protein